MSGSRRTDHFQKEVNKRQFEAPDYNFNFVFDDQPQVAKMHEDVARQLGDLEIFHEPIPPEWLHLTVWYGSTLDYQLEEVLRAAEILEQSLADFHMPTARLSTWWKPSEKAIPIFDVTSKEPFRYVNSMARLAMQRAVGDRVIISEPTGEHDPHVATRYAKTYERTEETDSVIQVVQVEPVEFTLDSLVLITQYPNDPKNPNHYEWDIIQEIPIGTQN